MVLESTMICVDDSDYMRNGDFAPTRLQAQQDAVFLICDSKTRSNPENDVGLLTLSDNQVLVTLTADVGKIIATLQSVVPDGKINLNNGIKVARLALRHRMGRNHRMRIVVFIGSPLEEEGDLYALAKKLKKENVNIDVINFGEEPNIGPLTNFINILNGKEGAGSHLLNIPTGPHLSDAIKSSPIIHDDGYVSPSFEMEDDPELAMALRISMEEERERREREQRKMEVQVVDEESKEMLRKALEMSLEEGEKEHFGVSESKIKNCHVKEPDDDKDDELDE